MIDKSKFIAARKASGLTIEEAAKLADVSSVCYINREKYPEQFRLCELQGVYNGLSDIAKPLLATAVSDIFLQS